MRRRIGRIKSEQHQEGEPWRGGWVQAESDHDCISSANCRSLVKALLGQANGPVRLSDQRVSWFGCCQKNLRVSWLIQRFFECLYGYRSDSGYSRRRHLLG
jgi:hypothetical protein